MLPTATATATTAPATETTTATATAIETATEDMTLTPRRRKDGGFGRSGDAGSTRGDWGQSHFQFGGDDGPRPYIYLISLVAGEY